MFVFVYNFPFIILLDTAPFRLSIPSPQVKTEEEENIDANMEEGLLFVFFQKKLLNNHYFYKKKQSMNQDLKQHSVIKWKILVK